jgi:hypothetical protein
MESKMTECSDNYKQASTEEREREEKKKKQSA